MEAIQDVRLEFCELMLKDESGRSFKIAREEARKFIISFDETKSQEHEGAQVKLVSVTYNRYRHPSEYATLSLEEFEKRGCPKCIPYSDSHVINPNIS